MTTSTDRVPRDHGVISDAMTVPFRPPRLVVRRENGLDAYESALSRAGFAAVAGADEAGRGACAGSAGRRRLRACAAGRRGEIDGLADSKVLTAATRERLFDEIIERARSPTRS